MKRILFPVLLLMVLSACTPPQQILNSWEDREAIPKTPYKSIFIIAFAQDINAKVIVENELAKAITARGQKAVKSSDVFTSVASPGKELTREQLIKTIREAGCDGVFTVELLDVKTDESYQPGNTYYPVEHSFYDSYNRYAVYYYTQVDEPDYIITNTTYYLEGKLYDLASDKLIWAIQTDSYNPSDVESWFKDYAKLLLKHLKKEGLITK